jgi:nitrogen fixation protein FixH
LAITLSLNAGCAQKAASPSPRDDNSDASPLRITLTISPDHPRMVKPITFTLHIVDPQGKPVDGLQVNGSLNMRAMNMGETQVKFDGKGNGDYEGSVKDTDMSGPWTITVDASQGKRHAQKNFEFVVGD